MKARSILSASAVALALALPATASASSTTLGSIVTPAWGSPAPCNTDILSGTPFAGDTLLFGQATPAYEVGTNGLEVTSWSVNATGDTDGGTETLYVLAPSGAGYTVAGTDTETIPSVIPAGGTLTFTLASPIAAQSGDTFGLSATGAGGINCAWGGSSSDTADEVSVLIAAGNTVETPAELDPGSSGLDEASGLLDLAVTLAPGNEDAAVSTSAGPSNAVVNNEALLSSTVTNNGPFAGQTTFTDTVPAGLTINAAAASGATCTTAGQTVTCTFAGLAVGASAPVEIVVTPGGAQSYENTVSVADANGVTDPNPANNSASATLVVSAATITSSLATRECVSTNVKGLSEKVVKRLLPSFGCKLGKIKKASSKTVAKGDVISLNPGSGAHAPGTKLTLTVSSGKPKKKH
jgi:hypothetical protein